MSAAQLVQRILSAQSEIPLEKITRGKMEDYEYQQLHTKGIKALESAPIYIDDTAALNIFEFRAKARRLVNKHNVGIIIIDYLQLMSGSSDNKNGNREQEISNISRNLKALAKELNIPIIALSQLSRAVETRKESKIPQLSDLRESGAIEQDADMVMFIYRPEYHEINSNAEGESTKGETHIRIAKHRNGSLDNVILQAHLHIQRFEEMGDKTGISMMGGGSWKPIAATSTTPSGGAADNGGGRFFVQGSKMNTGSFDDGVDGDAPF
jgi:replicative DNA helicase